MTSIEGLKFSYQLILDSPALCRTSFPKLLNKTSRPKTGSPAQEKVTNISGLCLTATFLSCLSSPSTLGACQRQRILLPQNPPTLQTASYGEGALTLYHPPKPQASSVATDTLPPWYVSTSKNWKREPNAKSGRLAFGLLWTSNFDDSGAHRGGWGLGHLRVPH